jgi:O-antigen/teichoic acid export membrane protein/GT2 family glycosyltransferase/2-polyprenyl-3-methyl-5-hydroxy-6-metoxy-1,4-benzoquinol methylase
MGPETTSAETMSRKVKAPMVSVIVPAYRMAEFIGAAIDSIFAQTFTDYEVIIVNDGSPDTPDFELALEPYRERISYIKQENSGPSAARNVAIGVARGEFLAFLDADDYWEPNFLDQQIEFFKKNPAVDLVYSDALLFGDSPLSGRSFMEVTPSEGEVTFETLLGGRCIVILSGTVARRQAVINAGLFDEELRYAEDYDLWLRIAKNGSRLAYQRQVLLNKRIHAASLSSNRMKLHQSALRVLEKWKQHSELSQQERDALVEQATWLTAIVNLELGKARLSEGDFAGAQEAIKQANSFYKNWKLKAALFCLRYAPRLLLRIYTFFGPARSQQVRGDQSHERGDSLTSRVALYMFAKTIAFALSFTLPLLLVRRLSQHEFGLYKQVFLIVGTAISILPLGVGMSAYYFLPRERERQGQIVFNILLFYFVMAGSICLAFAVRPQLISTIFNSSDLVGYSPLIGLVIFLWVIASFLEIAAIAHQEFRLATVFVVGSQFTKTLLLLSAAIFFSTVWGLIYAAIIQGMLQTLVLLFYLRSRFGAFWRSFEWAMMRKQLAYALPLGIAAVIIGVQSDIDNYFVANQFGAAAYAIYAIGCFQLPIIGIISDSVGSVMIPRVSYLQKFDRGREIIELTAKMMRKLSAAYFPLYVFIVIFGREFITVLFTSQYLASYPIFAINLTLIPLAILTSASDPVMRAYAEHRYFLLKARVALLVILITGLWLFSKQVGMVGTITMAVGMSFIERLVSMLKAGRILQFRLRDLRLFKDMGKLAVAAAAAGATAATVRSYLPGLRPLLILIVCGIVFSIVYLAIAFLSGALTRDERLMMRRQLAQLWPLSAKRAAALQEAHAIQGAGGKDINDNLAPAATGAGPQLMSQVGALTEKHFWDSTHINEREYWDSALRSDCVERRPSSPKSRIKSAIKAMLGKRVLEYVRSYEDYLLCDVIYKKYLPKTRDLKVLEVGSAPGEHLVRLSKLFGFAPYGIEYSESGVELNREVFASNDIDPDNVIYADFLSDEVHEQYRGAFDIVISRGFIEHFTDVRSIVEKHINLLAEGGHLIISIPNLNGINYVLGRFFHKELIPLHNLSIMQKQEFMKLFDKQGVSTLFCDYYGTFNFGLFNSKRGTLRALALGFCMKLQLIINIALRLLFKEKGAESKFFSPALMFVGMKTNQAASVAEVTSDVEAQSRWPMTAQAAIGKTE